MKCDKLKSITAYADKNNKRWLELSKRYKEAKE